MPTVRLLSVASWGTLLNILDEGTPGSDRFSTYLLSGSLEGMWAALRDTFIYISSAEAIKRIITILVRFGIAEYVVENLPLKKSFTVAGFTIGF